MDNFLYGSYNHSKIRKKVYYIYRRKNMSIIQENKQNQYDLIMTVIKKILPDISKDLEMDIFDVYYNQNANAHCIPNEKIKKCFSIKIDELNNSHMYSAQDIQNAIENTIISDEDILNEYSISKEVQYMISTQDSINEELLKINRNGILSYAFIFDSYSTFFLISSKNRYHGLYLSLMKITLTNIFNWLYTDEDIPYDPISNEYELDNYTHELENIKLLSLTSWLSDNQLPNKEDFVYLSSLTYEKQTMRGYNLLFINSHPKEYRIELEDLTLDLFFSSENSRKIRKLLEMTSEEYGLVVWKKFITKSILGIANIDACESPIIVEFLNQMEWKIKEGRETIFHYKNGSYNICPKINDNIKDRLKDNLPSCNEQQLDNIKSIIDEASKQKHGTMLLFTKHAKMEAKRLSECERGFMIAEKQLINDLSIIEKITSIDGALIIDMDCNCYAIGAILDGNAHKYVGSSERGARYNSACTYLANKTDESDVYLAVVISEDGTIDVLTNKQFAE